VKSCHLVNVPLDRGGIQVTIKKVVDGIGLKKKFPAILYATVMPPTFWRRVSI